MVKTAGRSTGWTRRSDEGAPVGVDDGVGGAALRENRRARRRAGARGLPRSPVAAGTRPSRSRNIKGSRRTRSSRRSRSASAATRATRASSRRRFQAAPARCWSIVPTSTIATRCTPPLNIDYHDNVRCFAFLVRAALEFTARRCTAPSSDRAWPASTSECRSAWSAFDRWGTLRPVQDG